MTKTNFAPIFDFYAKHRRMPSYGEIVRLMGFKSKNSAYKLAKSLIGQGLMTKDPFGKLLPTDGFFDTGTQLRLLGFVEAGFPSPAEEELADTMSMDEYLVQNREATYILKVSGDSMIDAGIMPGDMVLVERRADAKDGDIVIAEIDSAWTMKYFRKKGSRIELVAANAKYPPFVPKSELKIAAVVKAVVRKY